MEDLKLEKGVVFETQAPNGVMIKAVVVAIMSSTFREYHSDVFVEYLCYSQNRLFVFVDNVFPEEWDEDEFGNEYTCPEEHKYSFGNTLVDYCVIPEYDEILKQL